jgi:putative copper resistance protein D
MDGPAWILLRGALRGLHIAGSFSAFGTMFLSATLLAGQTPPGLKRLAWASLGVALLAGIGWFLLQTADFASAQSFNDILAAIPIVAQDTRFGILLLSRCAALILAACCFQAGWNRIAALIALGTVIAESWLGHGGAMSGTIGTLLLITSIAHLTAAATWLGTLPALRLAIKRLPAAPAQNLAQAYSPLGIACVATLIITGAINYWFLIGRPAALITSAYGLTVSVKTLLLLALLTLATLNRTRLTPNLPTTTQKLLRNITAEITLGLLTLLAAGLILQLEPPAMALMTMGR